MSVSKFGRCCFLLWTLAISPLQAMNFECSGPDHQVSIQDLGTYFEIRLTGAHHAHVVNGNSRPSPRFGPLAVEFYGTPLFEEISLLGVLVKDTSIVTENSPGLLVLQLGSRKFSFDLICTSTD